MTRTIAQQLEHDMSCAIETQNEAEAKLVLAKAESAFDERLISSDDLAQLVFDFTVFQDSVC